jgi:hypothetical protein
MIISEYDKQNFEEIVWGHGTWFAAHLIRLIIKADLLNRERLRAGFPEEVAYVEKVHLGVGE